MAKVLKITTGDDVNIIDVDLSSLGSIRDAIGCRAFETAATCFDDLIMLIDEEGRICAPPKQFNEIASSLCLNYYGIVGDALVVKIKAGSEHFHGLTDEEAVMLDRLLDGYKGIYGRGGWAYGKN